jgi:hypothetical protein
MISAWRGHFPEFRVLSNHDIVPLIERRHSPACADLFNRIRLPSAKSDIARFVALYEFGGLYVDCHNGIRDVDGLKRLLTCLNDYEAIVIDRRMSFYPRPPGEHFLISAPIFGRRHSELFMTLAQRGFANLAWQQHLEEQYGYVFYDVARLVGPTLINEIVLEPGLLYPRRQVPFCRADHDRAGGNHPHGAEFLYRLQDTREPLDHTPVERAAF